MIDIDEVADMVRRIAGERGVPLDTHLPIEVPPNLAVELAVLTYMYGRWHATQAMLDTAITTGRSIHPSVLPSLASLVKRCAEAAMDAPPPPPKGAGNAPQRDAEGSAGSSAIDATSEGSADAHRGSERRADGWLCSPRCGWPETVHDRECRHDGWRPCPDCGEWIRSEPFPTRHTCWR